LWCWLHPLLLLQGTFLCFLAALLLKRVLNALSVLLANWLRSCLLLLASNRCIDPLALRRDTRAKVVSEVLHGLYNIAERKQSKVTIFDYRLPDTTRPLAP
jgi:hypothetical protein